MANINNKRGKEVKAHFSQRNTTESVAERQGLQRGGSLYKTDWGTCKCIRLQPKLQAAYR